MDGGFYWLAVSTILPQAPCPKNRQVLVAEMVGLVLSPILMQALGMANQFAIVSN
jgi:hypothetical protein